MIYIKRVEKLHIPSIIKMEEEAFGISLGESILSEIIESPLMEAIGLFSYEELIGYVSCGLNDKYMDIYNIVIKQDYRGQGFGTKLISELLKLHKEVKCISLEVRESNIGAIKFYARLGFETSCVRKKYYADGEDALLLVKEIKYEDPCNRI